MMCSAGPYGLRVHADRGTRFLIDNIVVEQGIPRSFTDVPARFDPAAVAGALGRTGFRRRDV